MNVKHLEHMGGCGSISYALKITLNGQPVGLLRIVPELFVDGLSGRGEDLAARVARMFEDGLAGVQGPYDNAWQALTAEVVEFTEYLPKLTPKRVCSEHAVLIGEHETDCHICLEKRGE